MPKTSIVNVKTAEFDVYIGRVARFAKDPRCHEYSHFANPYSVTRLLLTTMGEEKARAHVIEQFRRHLLNCLEQDPGTWIPRLRAVKGKVLGCWCKPLACHGDVVAEYADLQVDT
jgi:hypothetical protein